MYSNNTILQDTIKAVLSRFGQNEEGSSNPKPLTRTQTIVRSLVILVALSIILLLLIGVGYSVFYILTETLKEFVLMFGTLGYFLTPLFTGVVMFLLWMFGKAVSRGH